ncbi:MULTISPECIES: sodium-dependent transporter [unclassified Vibrio]|uniref:sodium-dependent transporter n=1 Tax=unclassified Vibrio TaxID=2614977 RepID=UPI0025546DF7|nr:MULTISPECIES: sodium-dependent transporter [unclassified Vibrio]MDK9776345.1 sodium-dependent transporter [Vibrio sp. D401a]MDK9806911.1 sodium-dependent transporter [Vibrio sp. D406a]
MKREQWGSRAGFILAAVGSAIGLGNIWRFPYMAYENGGGAFFIPYLFAMITAGIPFMILEFSMGQKYRGSAPKTLAKIHAKFEWLGWFQVGVAAVIAVYYVAVIGWAISYFGMSFTQSWGSDTNAFFFSEYLKLGDNSPTDLGSIQWKIAVSMLIAWAITYTAIVSGVKSGIERASKIMMPILFIMVIFLIGRMIFLPGALDGVNYMFEPDFSKIWDVKVWAAAYGQIFFTLSIGFAIMLAYSSYLPEKSDITNNAFMTVLINCGFSILAGIMIFSVLGYMAQEQGKPLTEVVSAGVGLAFVTLPAAINLLPAPYILGPLFFFALVVAGLSSHISIMEAVTSAVIDKLKWSRKKAANVVIGTGFVVSMAFAANGGLLLLDLVDHFANNVGIMVGGLVEIVLMAWLLKQVPEVRNYVNERSDFSVGQWFEICLRFVTPIMLAVILATKLYALLTEGYGGYDLTLGWVMIAALFVSGVLINVVSKEKA